MGTEMDNKTIVGKKESGAKPLPPILSVNEQAEKRARRLAKIEEWKKLPLRQIWMDEEFMRQHLVRAGIRVPITAEPATAKRMRALLRRAGMNGVDVFDAMGCNIDEFIRKNENLPLWVAIAHILEASRKFEVSAES